MRILFTVMCVLGLGLMGCSEAAGTGGIGGSAGTGGDGGSGGSAGSGGMGGGGTGGMPECQNPEDCNDDHECTEDACSIDGECSNAAVADNTDCDFNGLPGRCMSGVCEDAMLCEGVICQGTECKTKTGVCNPNNGMCDYTLVENGTGCSLGECLNGVCGGAITVGCTNNVSSPWNGIPEVSIFRFDLQVEPGPIVGGNPFSAELTGVARFPELWLDAFQWWIPGGVRSVALLDLAATVSVRSGATGPDVELGIDAAGLSPGPTRLCAYPGDQVCTADSDCIAPPCKEAILLQDIPVIEGTPNSANGCTPPVPDCDCSACLALDKEELCLDNGFCVAGDLLLPLEKQTGNYIADPVSGTPILFGWFDGNPPPTNPDGTLELPPAVFSFPTAPVGMRVSDEGGSLFLTFQCLMGVDSGGPYGIGIPDKASPTPDSLLITFLVP